MMGGALIGLHDLVLRIQGSGRRFSAKTMEIAPRHAAIFDTAPIGQHAPYVVAHPPRSSCTSHRMRRTTSHVSA